MYAGLIGMVLALTGIGLAFLTLENNHASEIGSITVIGVGFT